MNECLLLSLNAYFKLQNNNIYFIAFVNSLYCLFVFSMYRPNVCTDQEMSMLGGRQPCVQALTRMVKVWKQGCTGHRWCIGYERR